MNLFEISLDKIVSMEMIDNQILVITMKEIERIGIEDKKYKISYNVMDNYVYIPKDNKIVITLQKREEKEGLRKAEGVKPKGIEKRRMSDYNKYLNDGAIIRYVYKNDIYYGIYNKNKKLINNKYRSLSGFVSEMSGGKNKNGWGKCEKLEENGVWVCIDS
jgi:hypothetical protein